MFFEAGQRFRRRRRTHAAIEDQQNLCTRERAWTDGGTGGFRWMDGWLPMLKRYSRGKKRRRGEEGKKERQRKRRCWNVTNSFRPVARSVGLLASGLEDSEIGLTSQVDERRALPQRGGHSWFASRVSSPIANQMRQAPARANERAGAPSRHWPIEVIN